MEDKIIVVMGYGCNLSRQYQEYLNLVVERTKKQSVRFVIASGGFTNQKNFPQKSEAGIMTEYFLYKGIEKKKIIENTNSITTAENLIGAKKIIENNFASDLEVVIFCDLCRKYKVAYLAKKIFGYKPEIKCYDLTLSILGKTKQYLITPINILAFKYKIIKKLENYLRIKKIKRL